MKNSAIKWLYHVTGTKKAGIALLMALQVLLGFSSVCYAIILRNIIDNATGRNQAAFWRSIALIVGLVAAQIGLRAVVRWMEEFTRSSIENELKRRLFTNLLKKDYGAVTAVHSGEWLNRLSSDTVVCAGGIVDILPGIVGMLVKMAGALVMILVLEPRFAYVLVPGGGLLILLTYAFRKVLKGLHKSVQEQDGKLRIFLQEHLGSLVIVRTFATEAQVEKEALEKMADHKGARMKKNHFSNVCNIGFATAMNGMYLLGLVYCGYGIILGTISYGTLMAILQLISQIQSPFANITGYFPKFYAMIASAERLMEAERLADDSVSVYLEAATIHEFYEESFEEIGLVDAEFTYLRSQGAEESQIVLKDVSLSIRKGEYVALTGESGCGKSTLLKLLMCLYRLNRGERYLVTQDGRMQTLSGKWRRLFAYVPQGNMLMSGTIREVIAFADKTQMYDEQKLKQALRIACAEEFVEELEKGLDTELGERGQGLSEGQMQRIAIARAIFSGHPILMLDEATSALDEQTEKKLLENLRSMTDKTVLIVTHRPAALEICDKVVAMHEDGINVKCVSLTVPF